MKENNIKYFSILKKKNLKRNFPYYGSLCGTVDEIQCGQPFQ